jgi:DNA-binding helix-hairpin-helix protein with protein kinase domain
MRRRNYFYLDTNRNWYPIDIPDTDEKGRGATGAVYRIAEDKVAKRYFSSFLTETKKARLLNKITKMAFKHRQFAALKDLPLAWPLGPLINSDSEFDRLPRGTKLTLNSDEFCGFVMPLVSDLYNWDDVISESVLGTRAISGMDRIRIARRLAEIVQLCHDANLVIGDVNTRNVVVSARTLLPTIIDCDSFQYEDDATDYGLIEFASPELLRRVEANKGFDGLLRNLNDDRHALAVLLFMLFMNAAFPFDCAGGSTHVANRKSAVVSRSFPYSKRSLSRPPSDAAANRYARLPGAIRALFEKQLFDGISVPAEAWIEPLNAFATEDAVKLVAPEPKRSTAHVAPRTVPTPARKRRKWTGFIVFALMAVIVLAWWIFTRQ